MMQPTKGMSKDILNMCCDVMNSMMNSGMPMMMCCGNVPLMACMA
jgi:hypothetical protein